MSDDLLVRTHDDRSFNLAVGEPFIFQEAFKLLLDAVEPICKVTYPILGGEQYLIEQIRKYFSYDSTYHVVVANGAKQALLAAMWALKGPPILYHKAPYWLSFPTLAKLSGMAFSCGPDRTGGELVVNTSPNNPDGSISDSECDIWDASYAHEEYGFSVSAPKHRISVWSASKMLGASGMRVGWLVTQNADLARDAARYVEITTSGVSIASQCHVASMLRQLRKLPGFGKTMIHDGLSQNANLFNQLVAPYCKEVRGVPATDKGMFAWFQPENTEHFWKAAGRANVKMVGGEAFGGDVSWVRMSMGQLPGVTHAALNALAKELAK